MNKKKILIYIYKVLSIFYTFIFGRKKLQSINHLFFSLTLDAKGFKNYGSFKKTGEEYLIKLIKDEVNLSLDIGANIGKYSELILEKTNSDLYSFEPLPKAYSKLLRLKKKYKNRINCFNYAIGDFNGSQNLYFNNSISEKASLIKDLGDLSFVGKSNRNKIKIKVKKLDDISFLFKNKIDFIKIDTEGYENNVLEGGIKLLKKHKPKFIQLEFNWHQLIKNQTLRNLSKLIYFSDVYRILPNNYGIIKIDPSRPENNIYHLSNYIFINKNISKKFK